MKHPYVEVIYNDNDEVQETRQNSHFFFLTDTDVYNVLQTVSTDHKFFFSVFVYLSFYCLASFSSFVARWQSNYIFRVPQSLLQSDILLALVGSPTEVSITYSWVAEMPWLNTAY
jgi:hypothetical protein